MSPLAPSKLTTEERVVRSRVFLLMRYPFFGTLLLNLIVVPVEHDPTVKTAATNGKHLFYNPDFIAGLSDAELNFVLVHEVLHPALGHLWRRGARNAQKWNYAADFCINLIIMDLDTTMFRLPKGVLYDKRFAGLHAEEVYELLDDPEQLEQRYGVHGSQGMGGHDKWGDGDGDDKSVEQQEREWEGRLMAAAAAQGLRSRGDVPAFLRRLLNDLLHPKKDWTEAVAEFVSHEVNDYSFTPPDRRFMHGGLILPDFGEEVEVIKDLIVAVDTSGSVNQEKLMVFISEIMGLVAQYPDITGHLLYFDAEVAADYPLELPDTWEPMGGGGTDFRPIFQHIAKHEYACSGVIVLTDLDGHFPNEREQPTDYPVLWVCDNRRHEDVPFGQLTYID